MAQTKLVVIYPYPTDPDTFERAYLDDHVPLAKEKIKGVTKFVLTKIVGTPDGQKPPFYRIAELHFPSMRLCKNRRHRQAARRPLRTRSRSQLAAGRLSWWPKKRR